MDREHKWRFSSRGSHYIVTVIKMTRDKVFYKFHATIRLSLSQNKVLIGDLIGTNRTRRLA
jgi:hypothetical protein